MSAFKLIEQPDVLTAQECEHLIAEHRHGLQPSTAGGGVRSSMRSSFSYKLPSVRHDIAEKLRVAIATTTGATAEQTELWELLHYVPDGFFKRHYDGKGRTHSAILYLNDVPRGGETIFPYAGLCVAPRRGLLIAWNNLSRGVVLTKSCHEAAPVLVGEKWALVTWIRGEA